MIGVVQANAEPLKPWLYYQNSLGNIDELNNLATDLSDFNSNIAETEYLEKLLEMLE
ncbi:MAG: hypothetical protein MZV70_76605 [Desulfobacterales bacterium]|nr:hypothetical protein [Desulfobacterales bacterium]